MGSRGGQSLISTEFHVLTIRGIQVDGRCEIGERGRHDSKRGTNESTLTARRNEATWTHVLHRPSPSSTSPCNLSSVPPPLFLLPFHATPWTLNRVQLAPIVAYGDRTRTLRVQDAISSLLGMSLGRVAAPVPTGAASLSLSFSLRTSLLR